MINGRTTSINLSGSNRHIRARVSISRLLPDDRRRIHHSGPCPPTISFSTAPFTAPPCGPPPRLRPFTSSGLLARRELHLLVGRLFVFDLAQNLDLHSSAMRLTAIATAIGGDSVAFSGVRWCDNSLTGKGFRTCMNYSGHTADDWGSRGREFKSRQPDNTMADCHA
jgi:hypothetical protein